MKRLLASFLCAFAFQATVAAHVLDEYVQAAQISLVSGGVRVELRLVPGVEVADHVFKMIDVDNDREISPAEEQAYARRVIQDITLEVDERRAPLELKTVHFPSRREMKEGIGAIRLDLTAAADLGAAVEHRLSFRNDHLPDLGVYLVNALVPTIKEIEITGQTRDPLQHELQLRFRIARTDDAGSPHPPRPWTGVLMLCLGVVLLFPQWKHLQYLRPRNDEHIRAKKTY